MGVTRTWSTYTLVTHYIREICNLDTTMYSVFRLTKLKYVYIIGTRSQHPRGKEASKHASKQVHEPCLLHYHSGRKYKAPSVFLL